MPSTGSVENAITRSTVQLLAGSNPATLTSTGTGFYYKVVHPTTNLAKILIITNKHVVRGASMVQFVISSAPSITNVNGHRQPIDRRDDVVNWSLNANLLEHPDPQIDLCAIDVTIPLGNVLQSGRQLRSMFIDRSWLPSPESRSLLRDIEQVLVVGYPHGIWDQHNNMPVARIGTTATHPLAMYQGKSNFLIDVAAFGGSSGSPVFTYESPMFRQDDGNLSPGTKVQFLGVIWGVLEKSTSGSLRQVEIPAALTVVPTVATSLNLALALHGEAILAIDELVFPGIGRATARSA